MSGCVDACMLEGVSQDEFSIGVIEDHEEIARGVFDPSNGVASTLNVRNAVVSPKELAAGMVSVYRLDPKGIEIKDLVPQLDESRPGQRLFAIASVPASKLRALRRGGNYRAVCVLDECMTDFVGGKHEAHAHISICRVYKDSGVSTEDPAFIQILRDVRELYRATAALKWVDKAA